jgi:hypothetical protein
MELGLGLQVFRCAMPWISGARADGMDGLVLLE